jgi:long-chain acyl-CoA synthetase
MDPIRPKHSVSLAFRTARGVRSAPRRARVMMEPRSLYEAFQNVATAWPAKVAYRVKSGGRFVPVTWSEQRQAVLGLARSLLALGAQRGDRVAILARTRLEWIQADTAIVGCGAATVGVYPSNTGPDCAWILRHSGSSIAIVEDQAQLDKVLAARSELPELRQIVCITGDPDPHIALSWDAFLERGREVPVATAEAAGQSLGPEDLAALVYTSGTTGQPKGAMISHGNLLFTAKAACTCLVSEPHYETLLFLPLAHVFARLAVYMCQRQGLTVALSEGLDHVPAELREIRPHFLLGVPRVYEKFRARILSAADEAGAFKRAVFHWSLGVGLAHARLKLAGKPIPSGLALRRAVADRLALRKVRDALGGRLAWVVSGSAPLGLEVLEFFHACGIPLIEGLGMTENTSLSNVNRLDRIKPGTVGPPVPGVEMKLAPDGEILFRSPNVMQGYFRDPQATAETLDAEGWLHTGDVGRIDADGFLTITDRKKELIKTSGGKYVAPQRLEKLLSASPYIAQAVVFGDRQKFITALLTLEPAPVLAWAREHRPAASTLEQLAFDPELNQLIGHEVEACNRALASFETVKRFRILPHELSVEGGDLTPTLKPRRKAIYEKHRALIESMGRD